MNVPLSPPPSRVQLSASYIRVKKALYRAYMLLGLPGKAYNILDCSVSFVRWQCADCQATRDLPLSCGQRLCPNCSRKRANRIVAKYHTALTNIDQPKMLTLTYPSANSLTKDLLKQCTRQFASFRRSTLWKDNVEGGIAGLELTYGDAGWHPHTHALIDSEYIPVVQISRTWKKYSKGAMVVDIRAVERESGVFEVVKYTAKSVSFYKDPKLVWQYLEATYKARFLTTFGSFYRAADPLPALEEKTKHKNIFEPYNLLPPGAPRLHQCPICYGTDIICKGKVSATQIKPDPVQIPF